MKSRWLLIGVLSALMFDHSGTLWAKDASGPRPAGQNASVAGSVPYPSAVQFRVHHVGQIRFGISNRGVIGGLSGVERNYCTNGFPPSFEFPKRSNINYLYQGALWVGAVKGSDTLVSVGSDGWSLTYEMYPLPPPAGDLVERTTRPVLRAEEGSTCPDVSFSFEAVSEQDFVTAFADTLQDTLYEDPFDGRYRPLGVKISQASYAWSYDYADQFIIVDWQIENISPSLLHNVRLGLFLDPDVGSESAGDIYSDDVCGFVRAAASPDLTLPDDSMTIVWAADNDGDPAQNTHFDDQSPTAALGVRFLRTPTDGGPESFNWWTSNTSVARDWGPNKRYSGVFYLAGNLGTPLGDKAKYASMGNGEFDYDQIESALDHTAGGWLPPVGNDTLAQDIANGRDIYMLISIGQFDLAPGQSVPLTVALLAGPGFHRDPHNFSSYWDPYHPDQFKARLDFSGLARNARWAGWVYDNPGRDTDGNGFRGKFVVQNGDTLYYTGDGWPDYRGPDAPPAPWLYTTTSPGRVVIRWNGYESERARDPFTHVRDFEGYRVYMGRNSWPLSQFSFLAQRERTDFVRYEYEPIGKRWFAGSPALTLDSLKALYDSLSLEQRGYPFEPDSFADTSLAAALQLTTINPIDPGVLDTHYYAFAPYGDNLQVDDRALYFADSAGANVVRVIRKPYPFAAPDDTMWRDDGTPFLPYWEYEYALDGLYPGEGFYVAVTCYDFGDPPSGVGPTEGSIYGNMSEVWPVAPGYAGDTLHPTPGVYPNPYRAMDDYVGQGYEQLPYWPPNPEYARQMTFYNLPDTCTISIWTLDGDLVRELRHREWPGSPTASIAAWDLINRNQDIITHGLYIYSIESSSGTFVGKLAIIR